MIDIWQFIKQKLLGRRPTMIYIQESMFLLLLYYLTHSQSPNLLSPNLLPEAAKNLAFLLSAGCILCQATRPSSLGLSVSGPALLGIALHSLVDCIDDEDIIEDLSR